MPCHGCTITQCLRKMAQYANITSLANALANSNAVLPYWSREKQHISHAQVQPCRRAVFAPGSWPEGWLHFWGEAWPDPCGHSKQLATTSYDTTSKSETMHCIHPSHVQPLALFSIPTLNQSLTISTVVWLPSHLFTSAPASIKALATFGFPLSAATRCSGVHWLPSSLSTCHAVQCSTQCTRHATCIPICN